jgi:hypothetical protein
MQLTLQHSGTCQHSSTRQHSTHIRACHLSAQQRVVQHTKTSRERSRHNASAHTFPSVTSRALQAVACLLLKRRAILPNPVVSVAANE